ncbi:MAG: lysozyme, partial [Deltaproteobacteria bacterium]|nr:lysozyme [Deltaproteobacteria bacterium]
IDVSHHQGKIDWQKLRRAGIDFAYIKATEGGDFRDPRFAEA